MQVWLGTSGYSYPHWVGSFYPAGTRQDRMLAYYCRRFPLVELNFTYYRLPTPEMLGRLGDQTPDGFQFLVKLPRTLSHEQDPAELPAFREAVKALEERGKLLGLLCQLPQAHHHERKHLDWLERLSGELSGYGLAVEFRHFSWHCPEVTDWLRSRNLDVVSVDVPSIPALFPRGLVQSGPRIYVRFHSRSAPSWYGPDKDRYDFNYDEAALNEWVDALHSAAGRSDRALLLFNNCQRNNAPANAEKLAELLSRRAPELTPVPAFDRRQREAEQGWLFE
jgi:uncharacterized protein YecE (DUF72 family)